MVNGLWGPTCYLGGFLGSVAIFHDALSASQIHQIYAEGPNNTKLFCPMEGSPTLELENRLVLYYCPQASQGKEVPDLSPSRRYDANMEKTPWNTHEIRVRFLILYNIVLQFTMEPRNFLRWG